MKDGEKSLAKLFDLLEHIADAEDGVTSKKLSEITEIPLSTVFRMLGFLISRNYVRRDTARYYPGMASARLGRKSIYRDPLLSCVRPEMTRQRVTQDRTGGIVAGNQDKTFRLLIKDINGRGRCSRLGRNVGIAGNEPDRDAGRFCGRVSAEERGGHGSGAFLGNDGGMRGHRRQA